jgi:AcrR family transcriptional regulator
MAASTHNTKNDGTTVADSRELRAMPSLADASLLREPPATARGIRTRDGLIAAARQVFERDGYLDSRLTDITSAARCSTGTFYTYFASKEEIFHAVLESAEDDMLHPGFGPHLDPEASPYAVIAASNRAYLEAYQRNAKLMMLLEQVATIDARIREARLRRSRAFVGRNARGIARLQEQGLVDATLDPYQTALALSAMVSFTAYYTYCLEDNPISVDELTNHLTTLWTNALRLDGHAEHRQQ